MALQALVICSHESTSGDNQDFPKQKQILNVFGTWEFTFISPKAPNRDNYIKGYFPADVPKGEKYDLIWFCGCNGIYADWKILDVNATLRHLKKNGAVLFTEAPRKDFPHGLNISLGRHKGSILDIRAYENNLAMETQESMILYEHNKDPNELEILQYFNRLLGETIKIREKFLNKFRRVHLGKRKGFYVKKN